MADAASRHGTLRTALDAALERQRDEHRGPGRPRSAAAHAAILEATLDLLGEVGYDGLTIQAVAQRAGVGKATVYRRWSSKEALVIDLMELLAAAQPVPDTGDTRADLEAYVTRLAVAMADETYGEVLIALAGEFRRNPHLAQTFRSVFLQPRREAGQSVLRRGVQRGELRADLDAELVLDTIIGPLYHRRMVTGLPIDRALIDHLVRQVWDGARAR